MAVPLRVLAGRPQLTISQASFLPGSAECSDVLMVPAEERRQLQLGQNVPAGSQSRLWCASSSVIELNFAAVASLGTRIT